MSLCEWVGQQKDCLGAKSSLLWQVFGDIRRGAFGGHFAPLTVQHAQPLRWSALRFGLTLVEFTNAKVAAKQRTSATTDSAHQVVGLFNQKLWWWLYVFVIGGTVGK